MRLVTVALLAALLGLPPSGRTASAPEQPDDAWMQSYYQHPQPEKFEAEVTKMQSTGGLQEGNALPPLAAFFSRLFQSATPAQLDQWLKFVQKFPPKDRRVFLLALRWADTAATEQALRASASQPGDGGADARAVLDSKVPRYDNLSDPAPDQLDMCWGAFFATGDAVYALPVIRCAVLPTRQGTMNMSREAARWSLKSLCATHPKLRAITADFYRAASADEQKSLDELLKK